MVSDMDQRNIDLDKSSKDLETLLNSSAQDKTLIPRQFDPNVHKNGEKKFKAYV